MESATRKERRKLFARERGLSVLAGCGGGGGSLREGALSHGEREEKRGKEGGRELKSLLPLCEGPIFFVLSTRSRIQREEALGSSGEGRGKKNAHS